MARGRPGTIRLVAALVSFVLFLAATVVAVRAQRRAEEWVAHTIEVKAALGAYLVALVDAETGQRGYVITGKPEYLEPYTRADVGRRERAVAELTADNPTQQANVAHASRLAKAKLEELRYVVELRGRDPDAAVAHVKNDRGKALMDEIRQTVDMMVAEEDRLFAERTRASHHAYLLNVALLIGAASVAFGLALLFSLQLRRDLRISQEKAAAATFNDRFVAVLGHDLKNPLTAIRISADRLEPRVAPDLTHVVARILKSVTRMSRMIDQLLDVTRMRVAGGIPIATKDIELAELVRQAIDDARARSPETTIELTAEGDTTLRLDAGRIEKVVSVLIGNAVTYGTPKTPVRVAVRGDADRVVLSVTNEGALASDLDTLFEPFRRDARDAGKNPRSEALGLGLAIARHVVEQHGGTLDATSNDRTVFTATFPR